MIVKYVGSKELSVTIDVERIESMHYLDLLKDDSFSGERKNYWQMIYVDHGEMKINNGEDVVILSKGDVVFLEPNRSINLSRNEQPLSSLLFVSFICQSSAMVNFKNYSINICDDMELRELFRKLAIEARMVFSSKLKAHFASEQMLHLCFTQLLIELYRKKLDSFQVDNLFLKRDFLDDRVNAIILFMEDNLSSHINLEVICKEFYLSKSYLKSMFKQQTSYTVMNYLMLLRMERAKFLIRENRYSVAQVSKMVGYKSVSHFSTVFKKNEGLSPKKYLESIKMLHRNF
ncbi:response regulator transcription factor [Vagococcus xieshaowenii]|uniref:AraC family transcriptional regulator n=1 Tax=Vagococcus xieshaowenii TaxID=2562451 RepID=A0AAJ5EEN8_9ENTE|nr:response regulator transcription factor [Vagococcus xieshaowenii]QCA29329.1 AraC family transcriptional regulator [Vagococcus xieshaowenii]TFZ41976.1 AraC family transcriptional regulator [Vagococcus xieshaowenii]